MLLLAWVPAAIGAFGVAPLTWWAVAAGYAGISWLLPGILVRAAVRDWARDRAIPHHRAAGLLAGSLAGLVLLFVAAAVIGT